MTLLKTIESFYNDNLTRIEDDGFTNQYESEALQNIFQQFSTYLNWLRESAKTISGSKDKLKVYNEKTQKKIIELKNKYEDCESRIDIIRSNSFDTMISKNETDTDFRNKAEGTNDIDAKHKEILERQKEKTDKEKREKEKIKEFERNLFERKQKKKAMIDKIDLEKKAQTTNGKKREGEKTHGSEKEKKKWVDSADMDAFEQILNVMEEQYEPKTLKSVIGALLKIGKNIAADPSQETYRTLKVSNEALQRDITKDELGSNLLLSFGFATKMIKNELCYFMEEPNLADTVEWCAWYYKLRDRIDLLKTIHKYVKK